MSDSEEENFCYFGKPLDPYDEDAFPKKRPISVEEQIATDANGRRRFHGAFTGGFSAGFFNTVGSLEGWLPSEFRSTRQEKAKSLQQRPEDFMDEEDRGEYGIAPETVRATKDYNTSQKRKRQVFADGPIPGDPVLHTLLTSGNETIGYLLLKNMGIQEKIDQQKEELQEQPSGKVYGCEMPARANTSNLITKCKQYEIPSIYKEFLAKPKSNTFGLGYSGLDKSHVNLFQSTALVMRDKNNKKISIRGQAFGVGAFEEDDDDIYVKDDMSNYDFEMTNEKGKAKKGASNKEDLKFEMFVKSKMPLLNKKLYQPPTIPTSFTGKHKVKKSRFEPIPEPELTRKDINPETRARSLGESSNRPRSPPKTGPVTPKASTKPSTSKETPKDTKQDVKTDNLNSSNFMQSLVFDRFVSASKPEDISNILEPVSRTETEHGTQEMRDAAKMKMFGPLTRITIDWYPNAILCKRFNVPEPLADRPEEKRKRTKNLIFEYQKHDDENNISFKAGLSKSQNSESMEATTIKTEIESEVGDFHNDNNTSNDNIAPEVSKPEENQEQIADKQPDVEIVEKPKDITEKVDVEKNMDLFKSVFLSSSSETSDEEESPPDSANKETPSNKLEEMKANVLSDELIPKIRPRKEGILSNVEFKFKKPEPEKKKIEQDEHLYGPKIPDLIPKNNTDLITTVKGSSSSSEEDDEWVEKSEKKNKKKKHKHKKKHKKEKKKKKDKKTK